jgi:hypothetical protein
VKSEKESKIVMVQHLLDRLIQKFEEEIIGKQIYKTPGTPRFKIQRPTKDMEVFDTNWHKKYQSRVLLLLYLTKYSRPDISKVVRELSKCINGVKLYTYHEMLRVIKFVIDTKILD